MVVVMLRLDAGLTLLALAVAPFMAAAAWLFGRPMRARGARPPRCREPHPGARPPDADRRVGGAGLRARRRRATPLPGSGQRGDPRASAQRLRRQRLRARIGPADHGRARRPVMWAAAMRVLDGRLTVGTALVFLAYLATLQWQLSAFAAHVHHAAERRRQRRSRDGCARRATSACRSGAARRRCRRCAATSSIEDVDFGYQPDQPVLRGVSLAAAAGRVVAIVGATGAGKSTLVGPHPALLRSDRRPGADRRPRRARRARSTACATRWRSCCRSRSCSRVSVAENIALGRPGATRERDRSAPRGPPTPTTSSRALPQGYDTVHRRTRRDAVGRRAAAHRHRPRAAEGRADPDPRRADQRARCRRPSTPSSKRSSG